MIGSQNQLSQVLQNYSTCCATHRATKHDKKYFFSFKIVIVTDLYPELTLVELETLGD